MGGPNLSGTNLANRSTISQSNRRTFFSRRHSHEVSTSFQMGGRRSSIEEYLEGIAGNSKVIAGNQDELSEILEKDNTDKNIGGNSHHDRQIISSCAKFQLQHAGSTVKSSKKPQSTFGRLQSLLKNGVTFDQFKKQMTAEHQNKNGETKHDFKNVVIKAFTQQHPARKVGPAEKVHIMIPQDSDLSNQISQITQNLTPLLLAEGTSTKQQSLAGREKSQTLFVDNDKLHFLRASERSLTNIQVLDAGKASPVTVRKILQSFEQSRKDYSIDSSENRFSFKPNSNFQNFHNSSKQHLPGTQIHSSFHKSSQQQQYNMEEYGSQFSQVENPSISQNRSIKAKLENSHLLHSVQNELSVIMSCDRASMVNSSTHHLAMVEARNDSDQLNYTIVNNHAHSNHGTNKQEWAANDFKMKVLSIHTSAGSSINMSSQNRYRNQQSGVQSTQIVQQDSLKMTHQLKQQVPPQNDRVLSIADQNISRQSTEKAPGASVVTLVSPPTVFAQTNSLLQTVQTKYLCGGSGETAPVVSRQEAVGVNKESLIQIPMAVQSQPSQRKLEALLHSHATKKLSNETVVISLQNGGANPDIQQQEQEHPKIQILQEESKHSDMFQSMHSRQMVVETPPSLNLRLSSSDIQGFNSGTHYQDSSSRGFSSNQRSQTLKRSLLISPNIIITRPPEEESKSSSMRRAPTWTPSNDESDKSTRKNNNSKRREPPQQFKNRKLNNNDLSTDEDQFLKQLSRSINQANKQRSFSTKVNENQNTFADGTSVYVVQDQISQSNLQTSSVLSINPQKIMKRKHKNQPFVVRWVNDKLINVKTGKVIGTRHGHHVDITSSTGQEDSSNVSSSQHRLIVQSPSNQKIMFPRMNQNNLHQPLAPIEERSGTSFTNSAAATTSVNKVPVSPLNWNQEDEASINNCDNADVVFDCTPKSSQLMKKGTSGGSAHATPKYSQGGAYQRVKILEEIREDDAEKDGQDHQISHNNKPFTQSKFRKRSSKVITPQNKNLQADQAPQPMMMSFTEMANNALQNSQINQQSRQNPLENNKQIDGQTDIDNTAQFINNGQKVQKSTLASVVSANELLPQPDRSPESSQFIESKKCRRDSKNSKGKPRKQFNVEEHNLLQFEISKTKGLIKLVREAEIRQIMNKSKTPPPLASKNLSGSVGKGILIAKTLQAQDAQNPPQIRAANKRRSTVRHIQQSKEIPMAMQISSTAERSNEQLLSSPDDRKLYQNRKRRQSHQTTYQIVASKMLKQKSIILAGPPKEGNQGSGGTPIRKQNLDQKYSQ